MLVSTFLILLHWLCFVSFLFVSNLRPSLHVCVFRHVRLFGPHGLKPVGLLCPQDSQARILEWGTPPPSGDLLHPGTLSLCLLPLSTGFPGKNPGVGATSSFRGPSTARDLVSLSPALAGGFFTTAPPGKILWDTCRSQICVTLIQFSLNAKQYGF